MRPIAAAMPAASSTRKPVRPSSTTSGSAPLRKAITGVPQLAASMATSELVSCTRLGTSRQRAPARRRRFCVKPSGPEIAALAVEQGRHFAGEICLVRRVWKDLAADQQRHFRLHARPAAQGAGPSPGRPAIASARSGICAAAPRPSLATGTPFGIGGSMRWFGQVLLTCWSETQFSQVLGRAHSQASTGYQSRRQMHRRQHRGTRRRQVVVEIQPMHVDHVDAGPLQHPEQGAVNPVALRRR